MTNTSSGFSQGLGQGFRSSTGGAGRVESQSATARRNFTISVLTWTFILIVFLQKLSFPIGEKGLQLVLLICFAALGMLLLSGNATVNPRKLIGYLAFLAICYSVSIINSPQGFSLTSLLLLTVLYVIYIVDVNLDARGYVALLRNFQTVGVVVALLVYSNWVCNLIGVPWPNLDQIVPAEILFKKYVYIQPIEWGSPYTKPNAIFFLETSHTGQFLGLMLIIELCFFQRIVHILLFSTALVLTFSGTGVLLVALTLPFILPHLNSRLVAAGLIALPLVAGTAVSIGLLDNATKRSAEFSQSGTSGNGRFVAPFEFSLEFLSDGGVSALIGEGAGKKPFKEDGFFITPPLVKMLYEYGVLAAIAIFLYTGYAICGGGAPFVIGWALLIQYHLLNGSALVPIHTLYCYIFAGAFTLPRGSVQSAFQELSRRLDRSPPVSAASREPRLAPISTASHTRNYPA